MLKTCFMYIRRVREKRKIDHLPETFQPERVIDIGCGMYPFPEFVFRDARRFYADFDLSNNPIVRLGLRGTFCQVDIENLPFGDRQFDFLHCSNVLEHVPNPEKGYRELRRVGRHGYVECPSAFRENIICHTGAHRWIVAFTENGVVKSEPRQRRILGIRVLPVTWIYSVLSRVRICWKVFEFVMQDCLGLMYVYTKF